MANLFFVLSGEHEDLPVSELKAILEAEGFAYRLKEKLDQVARLEAEPDCVEVIEKRAAFTRLCALELFTCEVKTSSIVEALSAARLDHALRENESFAVRVRHVKARASEIDGMMLERKLGELVLQRVPRVRVKLQNPDKTFVGILTSEKFVFGLRLAEIPAKPFVQRRPRKRPFFHPSSMQAKLGRCMVNLAQPRIGDLVLDPFCGTGTTLIEAALVGCRALGLDVQRRMARGTLRNLTHFNIKPEGVVVADARSLPLKRVDCLVTDPPYGTSSTTLKRTTRQVIEEVLTAVFGLLKNGRRICVAAPRRLNIVEVGVGLGYKHIESHFVYVHRSLTREVIVFEKV